MKCKGLFQSALKIAAAAAVAVGTPASHAAAQVVSVTITVHADQTLSPYTPVWDYFGADEPNYVYAPDGQKLLAELAALNPASTYMRVHNLLTTGSGDGSLKWGSTDAYTEDANGRPVYSWTITDRIFDAFAAAHVRPIVELGFMPEALSTNPEPYRHTFPKGSVFTGWSYPPNDYRKWSALVQAYATHLHARYGPAVDGWLWEVWNEPDIDYWHGAPEEYDKLYDVTAAAVRRALPDAKIGGPESTGPHAGKSEAFLRQFLEHCANGKNAATGATGAPLDFISFHPKGEPKVVDGHVEMNVGRQLQAVDLGMRVVASFPAWRHTPVILGESDPEGCAACGVAQNPQNSYRNGPLYGVSVAEATARTYELAARDGVRLQGAVTWAFEFEGQPWFAGFRELATHGVDKAVLNVFRLWGMLGGDWVATASTGSLGLDALLRGEAARHSDVSAVATRKGREVDMMLWNYDDRDLPAEATPVQLAVTGIPDGSYSMEQLLVDKDHGNAYGAWLQMGSPQNPDAAQQAKLRAVGGQAPVAGQQIVTAQAHAVTVSFPLVRQGVTLVRLLPR